MDTGVTQLAVEDEEFLVASLIERCPKTMMLRELVQNAIEAAVRAPAGERRVEIDTVVVEGGRKLRIRNTGPGMDEASLFTMCDIASSIGKIKGLDKNFGMGAKVASLPSNPLGVRYRSCCRGRVHEVVIGKRDGLYGRVLRAKPHVGATTGLERLVDVLDVTRQAREEGFDLSHDWTEVVLMGMRAGQDTAADPYDGDPPIEPHWLPSYLYQRYFRVPGGVEISIGPDYHWRRETVAFQTLEERAKSAFAHYECVVTPRGLKLHFFYDPTCAERPWENQSSEEAIQTAMGQIALVHGDEIYAVKTGSPWAYDAPMFGITFGARNTSVYIELPESYPVRPDTYRQELVAIGGAQDTLKTSDFAEDVRVSRPAWLLQFIDNVSGRRRRANSVINDLAQLSKKLNLEALTNKERSQEISDGPTTQAQDELGFDIVPLHDEHDINDRWLRGRAACFYPQTMQLFVNTRYYSVSAFKNTLQDRCLDLAGEPDIFKILEEIAVDCLIARVGRALLFAISKHLQKDDWQFGHIEKAMSPECFSIAGDDLELLLPWAEGQVRERLART